MKSGRLSMLMGLSKMHLKVSVSCSLQFTIPVVAVLILLICFTNLEAAPSSLGLGLAASVINGNETDREALLQFKDKIANDPLGVLRSWNSSIHFCQWRGVKCGRPHRRVTELDLAALKLTGPISPYIGNLSFLKVLDLQSNTFIQQIPQEIGRLRRLEVLALSGNSISGEIPSNISGCSRLTHIDIRDNLLSGEIPAAVGHLSNLKALNLVNNTLRGSIPPSLGNLSSLEVMKLGINRLSGAIPESLGQLKNLTIFFVYGNEMSGMVSSSLFNLSNMKQFDIGVNNLQGTLPSQLGFNMPFLEWFSIGGPQYNNEKPYFSGLFPVSINNCSNLFLLQLGGNNFTGQMPSFQNLHRLQILNIPGNYLGSQGANDLNFFCSLTNATNLEYVAIDDNGFGGLLPECVSNLSTTITTFVVQRNNIVGKIPSGFGNLINMERIIAGGNRLSGSIPSSIGRLQKLKILSIDGNSFSGLIPTSFGNLTMLIQLNLSGNNLHGEIPSSLGKCKKLNFLDLSYNNLSGSIPSQIGGLLSLSIGLNLSSNRLTGLLPSEVGNFRHLVILDVSENMLSGVIPNELGSCLMLEVLVMSGNFFRGPIPSSLSSLTSLANLDISRNNLTGEIPKFLVRFNFLHNLNLSYNNFEGLVPVGGVFKNASVVFLESNSKLCGGIPEFHLPTCSSLKQHIGKSTHKLVIAIVSALSGAILLFSFIFLYSSRKKRKLPASPDEENPLRLSYQSILKATNGFSSETLVGTGSFGLVYKGVLEENGTIIAVKVLKLLNHGASRSFLAECEALRNIRHRNLVKVLTACSGVDYNGNDFKALVYEFMANGNLEDWLHPAIGMNEGEEAVKSLNFLQRLNVAIDVGCALEYLYHHCETPVVHCDLKPSNILLDEEMVGRVGDFGLAKFIASDIQNDTSSLSSSLGFRGTIGYAPPEYGMGSSVTTFGDVYSYGIVLLEMFTGRRPTDEMFTDNLNLHNFVKSALPNRVADIADPTLVQQTLRGETVSNRRGEKLIWGLNSVFDIGVACSLELPTERMNMVNVVAQLCSIKNKLFPARAVRARGTG